MIKGTEVLHYRFFYTTYLCVQLMAIHPNVEGILRLPHILLPTFGAVCPFISLMIVIVMRVILI